MVSLSRTIKYLLFSKNCQVTKVVFLLVLLSATGGVTGTDLADVRCGSNTVGGLLDQGWRIVKQDYIKSIGRGGNSIVLEDGATYRADMTSGMLVGDKAILLSKYVKSAQAEGFIYNICAGGFDAWVTPVK